MNPASIEVRDLRTGRVIPTTEEDIEAELLGVVDRATETLDAFRALVRGSRTEAGEK